MKTVVHSRHLDIKEVAVNYTNEETQKKMVKFSIIGLIILFIGIIAYTINHFVYIALYPAEVKILVAPKDANLTIDGKQYPTSTTARFKEGEYNVKIEKDDFNSIETTLSVKNGEKNYLYEFLEQKDGDKSWFENDRENQIRFETISEFKARETQKKYSEDKIFIVTPYDNYVDGYKITASKKEDSEKISLKIHLYTCNEEKKKKYIENALNYLKSKDINIDNYEVEYSNCN